MRDWQGKYQRKYERFSLVSYNAINRNVRGVLNKQVKAILDKKPYDLLDYLNSSTLKADLARVVEGATETSLRFLVKNTPKLKELSLDLDRLLAYGSERVNQIYPIISQTTINDYRRINNRLMLLGKKGEELTRLMRGEMQRRVRIRGTMISITEGGRAFSTATAEITEGLSSDVMQQWVTSRDERTRKEHRKANGKKIKKGEMFYVGGESLRGPRMGNRAENNINCRCVATIVL